jgi:hypothetical protein
VHYIPCDTTHIVHCRKPGLLDFFESRPAAAASAWVPVCARRGGKSPALLHYRLSDGPRVLLQSICVDFGADFSSGIRTLKSLAGGLNRKESIRLREAVDDLPRKRDHAEHC